MRDYGFYIKDINEAIESILDFVKGMTFSGFEKDDKTISAVIRKFEIIGEAVKQVPDSIRDKYPDIPWKDMAGMRDKLIHFYFGINHEIIWETVNNRIKLMKPKIEQIIKDLKNNDN